MSLFQKLSRFIIKSCYSFNFFEILFQNFEEFELKNLCKRLIIYLKKNFDLTLTKY